MSETTYSIEHAKSGRAKCKKCKEKIEKGVLRLGVNVPGKDEGSFDIQSWYHPCCWNLPRKLKGVTAEEFVSDTLIDNTDEQVLQNDDEKDEIIKAIETKKKKASATTGDGNDGADADESKVEKIKARIAKRDADNNDDDDDKSPSKKAKLTDEEKGEMDIYSQYAPMKNAGLKDILKRNKQQVTGTKDILLVRCIDGHLNGRLGLCPSCDKGKLSIKTNSGEEAVCKGYYDKEISTHIPCEYKCPIGEATRFLPWYTEELTEEEEEQIEADYEGRSSQARATGGDAGGYDDIKTELIEKANEIEEWDLESKEGIQKATTAIVELCVDKLDVPVDDHGKDGGDSSPNKKAKMGIGRIITSNRDATASEIMEQIIEKYGFVEMKQSKADAKHEAAKKLCAHPSNVGILQAMLEFKELYFKEGNRSAGIVYDKVATSIRKLDYEITKDNALGLGKNKTKVDGIGKASAEKIYEFVTTGTIEKLEEKRVGLADY